MKLNKDVLDELRVEPGKHAHLRDRSTEQTMTDWVKSKDTNDKQTSTKVDPRKKAAEKVLTSFVAELATAQNNKSLADAIRAQISMLRQ